MRHEHEWKVWRDVELPDGKTLLPGVVSHSTTDCGLGGRVHPQIAWAKLQSLSDGAKLASERLRRG